MKQMRSDVLVRSLEVMRSDDNEVQSFCVGVGDADALLSPQMLYSLFFASFSLPAFRLFPPFLRSLFLRGNKCDRRETWTQCAQ